MTTSTPLFGSVDEEFEHIKNEPKNSKQWLWHECLRHPGQDKSKAIIDKLNGKHIVELDLDTALTCEQCIQSKSTSAQMGQGVIGLRTQAWRLLVHRGEHRVPRLGS